ncbi:MAG: hypothetical protein HQL30_00420 [Candidatus Omnitrophica bacterium]|nr:hypothetical protein [Candidatus Omnitrophota bacterium]
MKQIGLIVYLLILVYPYGWCFPMEDLSRKIDITADVVGVETETPAGKTYIALRNKIYWSDNGGDDWKIIDLPEGEVSQVKAIGATAGAFFILTGKGVYKSVDDISWEDLKLKGNMSGMETLDDNTVLLWKGRTLYFSEKGKMRTIKAPEVDSDIKDVKCGNGVIWIFTANKILYADNNGNEIKRYYSREGDEVTNGSERSEIADYDEQTEIIKNVSVCARGRITVSTNEALLVISDPLERPEKIDTAGLPSRNVSSALYTGKGIFASTGKRVFFREGPFSAWSRVFENTAGGTIKNIKTDSNGKYLWVLTGRRIFREDIDLITAGERNTAQKDQNVPEKDLYVPDIQTVQRMAIEYAEVSPDKINKWRQKAGIKAILPKVDIGCSRSDSDNTEIYTSVTTCYTVRGPRKIDNDWDIGLSWDLADIIWNDAQTSIDARSKLMVEMRNSILEEITRLYFERKKLVAEERPKPDMKHAGRIEEITAYMDAYTGGGFSRACK